MSYPQTFPGIVPPIHPGQLTLELYPQASEHEDGTGPGAVYNRMVKMGAIRPDCQACQEYFGTPDEPRPGGMAPSHRASARCESGKRPHCTCDTCF